MQYEQLAGGKRVDLPRPSIDTGMGLERIAAVLQGTHDNYDIDLFRALIRAIAELTGVAADGPQKASHRVIADHLRASAFLIADGVLPSNEGRGYVLRRIMRRAMRHAQLLGAKEPLMWRLVPALVREMGQAYPELIRAEALITETLQARGDALPQDARARPRASSTRRATALKQGDMFDGETAFTLYDTYGFPLDLTQDALRAARHRRRSRRASTTRWSASATRRARPGRARARPRPKPIWFALREKVGADRVPRLRDRERRRRGRRAGEATASEVDELKAGESGAVVVNQTPFYGESGGQVGDTGDDARATACASRVTDTQKKAGDLFVHLGQGRAGRAQGRRPRCCSRSITRAARAIRANHSATHLLHEALRQVLGDHVAQKGSLVAPDRLRFDFSHPKPMTRRGDRAGRGHRQRHRAAERAGDHAADGARRRASPPARARCSARNTATRCASSRWARATRQHARLVGRAVRRHPCAAHRRHRPDHRSSARAASPPACAASRR